MLKVAGRDIKKSGFETGFHGANDGARTRYLHLGKVALYQMSYIRIFCFLKHSADLSIITTPRRFVKNLFHPTADMIKSTSDSDPENSSESDTFFVFYSFRRYAIIAAKIT